MNESQPDPRRSARFEALKDARASLGAVGDQVEASLSEFAGVASHFFDELLRRDLERHEAVQLVRAFAEAHFARVAMQTEEEEEED